MFVSCFLRLVCGTSRVRLDMTCKQCSAKICESCQIVCYVFRFPEGQNGHDKAISTLSAFPWQSQWAYLSPRLMGLQHSNKGGVLRQTCGCRTWGNWMESGVYQTKWLGWLEPIADKAYTGNKRDLWLIIHERCPNLDNRVSHCLFKIVGLYTDMYHCTLDKFWTSFRCVCVCARTDQP